MATAVGLTVVKDSAKNVATQKITTGPQRSAAAAGEPRNILLVGGDDAAGMDKDSPVMNDRSTGFSNADVIMILRLDPGAGSASLLSIPRDTWVPVAPHWSKRKINSALSGPGGPENLVQTIKHDFGISIDNFVQVNFASFTKLVELLHGIPVYLDRPISDRNTSLWLVETGCITMDPPQALAYARSRHFRYQDSPTYNKKNEWLSDPSSDWGRITRQQDFLRKAGQRAIDVGIRSPATVLDLITAAMEAVTVDEDFSLGLVVDLLNQFRSFGVEGLKSYQIPTVSSTRSGTDSLDIVWSEAQPMINTFMGIDPEAVTNPRDVIVETPDGSTVSQNVLGQLAERGFDLIVGSADGEGDDDPTTPVIRYGPQGLAAAKLLAAQLGVTARLRLDDSIRGHRLVASLPGSVIPNLADVAADPALIPDTVAPTSKSKKQSTTVVSSTTTTEPVQQTTTTSSDNGGGAPSTTPNADQPSTTLAGINPIAADVKVKCGA